MAGEAFLDYARAGDTVEAEAELHMGADIHARDIYGRTGLMLACICGHKGTVRMLLDQGVEINDRDDNGNTALLYAIANGRTDIALLLLSEGAGAPDEAN